MQQYLLVKLCVILSDELYMNSSFQSCNWCIKMILKEREFTVIAAVNKLKIVS